MDDGAMAKVLALIAELDSTLAIRDLELETESEKEKEKEKDDSFDEKQLNA